jgi:hypothetical protein
MLGNLADKFFAVEVYIYRVQKPRTARLGEPNVNNRADNLYYLTYVFFGHLHSPHYSLPTIGVGLAAYFAVLTPAADHRLYDVPR